LLGSAFKNKPLAPLAFGDAASWINLLFPTNQIHFFACFRHFTTTNAGLIASHTFSSTFELILSMSRFPPSDPLAGFPFNRMTRCKIVSWQT
jgi:hypothetical protein